ncbi:MAG: hypothetical protein LR011_10160 [Verrucomicrobia bacterium]|nr:hypothetical protein [Verrucomicrobiota bacterium]
MSAVEYAIIYRTIRIILMLLTMMIPGLISAELLTIGEIQGIATAPDAEHHASPAINQTVEIQGILHQSISWMDNKNQRLYGFFIQNLPHESDQNPLTSDGLFIFSGKYPDLHDGKKQIPFQKGLHVRITGVIHEFFGSTQLSRPRITRVLDHRTNWERELNIPVASPPDDLHDSRAYWESLESMRVRLKAGAIVTGPSKTIANATESMVWVIADNHPINRREILSHRRSFRDAHPLDDISELIFDNQNGYRIALSSVGLLPARPNPSLIPPAQTLDLLERDLSGAVHFSFGEYKILVDQPPVWNSSNRFLPNKPPPSSPATWSVACFNLENLYDHRNDPNDPCDHVNDPGNDSVRPPFNYLPQSKSDYVAKLNRLANQIVHGLQLPDILMVQEIEDQDISFTGLNGTHYPKDDLPDVLQDLTDIIYKLSQAKYLPAANRNGSDARGISCAFLIRQDKWKPDFSSPCLNPDSSSATNLPYSARVNRPTRPHSLPVLSINGTFLSPETNSTTPVFSRALQVAILQPVLNSNTSIPRLYIINNHFSSIPDQRVSQRTLQARLTAAIAEWILKLDPSAGIILGGDLNVFPFPDDGTPDNPSHQLQPIYQLNWNSAYQYVVQSAPELAYSYIHQGQAQCLDHLFHSSSLDRFFSHAYFIHLNADLPDHPLSQQASDHDPVLLTFRYQHSQ